MDNSAHASLVSSDDVDGTDVYGNDGAHIGTIDHLMIDKQSGRVAYAVMGFGGFLGLGEDHHPVPWGKAITLFGNANTKNVVLEKSYSEYMEGFTDQTTGEARRGFVDVVRELEERFPDPSTIEKEADKKAFAKLFGEYLRVENILQNYDEFSSLRELQEIDESDAEAVRAFKERHHLSDDEIDELKSIEMPADRKVQDYRSTYNDIRDWLRREKASAEQVESTIDWDDVVFEVDLLESQEINLDYILELIFEHNKKTKSKSELVGEVRRVIRASIGNRAKESLIVDFINQTNLDELGDKAGVI